MKLLKGGLTGALTMELSKNGTKNLSKDLVPGTKYRIFFRKVGKTELLVASTFGRSLDYKALGGSFMGFEDSEIEYNEETQTWKDLTNISSLCRMARVLHKAACERETRETIDRIKKEAEELGQKINEVTIAEAARRLRVKYFGDSDVKPAVIPEVKQVISGVTTPHIIEAYAIPLTSTGTPEFTKGFVGTVELKSNKIRSLAAILQDPAYNMQDRDFLEVGFDYLGKDKAEAGRNASYNGIAESLTLESMFKDAWDANKDDIFNRLSKTEEEVFNRCVMFKFAMSAKDVVAAFNKYVSTQGLTLTCIDFESEDTIKAAEDFLELDAVKHAPKILTKFGEIAAKKKADAAPADQAEAEVAEQVKSDEQAFNTAQEVSKIKSIEELSKTPEYDMVSGDIDDEIAQL